MASLGTQKVHYYTSMLLSTKILCYSTPAAKGPVGKRQNGKPPPRLSMVYGDELSSDRVFKSRESVFAPGDELDTDSDDELYHGEESPLPDSLLASRKEGRELPVRPHSYQV